MQQIDPNFLSYIRNGGWKKEGDMARVINRLFNHIDWLEQKSQGPVKATVGVLQAEVSAGPDNILGTEDDKVVIKKALRKRKLLLRKRRPLPRRKLRLKRNKASLEWAGYKRKVSFANPLPCLDSPF